MDGCVFGRHEGDLPLHLLQEGEPGNRIRAMARLEGPDHNIYYAIEAPDRQAFDSLVANATGAGSIPMYSPDFCIGSVCIPPVTGGGGGTTPSYLPPWVRIRFLIALAQKEHEKIDEAIVRTKERLGPDSIAFATDGKGMVIIEVGSNDEEPLEAAMRELHDATGTSHTSSHLVTGGIQYG